LSPGSLKLNVFRRGAEAHDGGADHLRRGAAEDPLRRRVEEHDPSLLVGHDDRVQRELDDGREPRLALPHRLLRLVELGDVLGDGAGAGDTPLLVAERAQRDPGPVEAAVLAPALHLGDEVAPLPEDLSLEPRERVPVLGRVGVEVERAHAAQLLVRVAGDLGTAGIPAPQPTVAPEREVGERCVLVEVAVEGLALTQRALRAQAADLGAGPRCEDAHDREPARTVPHRLVVADREMAHDRARGIDQRHPAVAVDAPVDEGAVRREELLQPLREVRHLSVQHALAGGAGQRDVDVGQEGAAAPERPRPEALAVVRQLRDEGVLRPQGGGEVLHERGEELVARLGFDAFDDRPECRVLR